MALHVDSVKGLLEYGEDQLISIDDVLSQKMPVNVVRIVDGLVLLYDPAKVLERYGEEASSCGFGASA